VSLKKTIDRSWQILDFKEKQKLVVAIFFQSLLNFLDLVGVIFLSFTTYILANNKIPSFRQLEFLNSIDQNRIAFACVAFTIFLFTCKGLLAPALYSRNMVFLTRVSVKSSLSICGRFFSKPVTFVKKNNSQESAYALSQGVTSSINEILGSLIILISEAVLLFSLVTLMFFSNWILSILNIVIFGASLFILNQQVGDRQFKNSESRVNAIVSGNSLIVSLVSAHREIMVLGKQKFFLTEFADLKRAESGGASKGQVLNMIPKYVFEITFYLGAGGILLFLYYFAEPEYAFTLFVLFIASGSRILPSILRIQAALSNIRSNEALSLKAFSLISELDAEESRNSRKTSSRFDTEIENLMRIRNLRFSYDSNPNWELSIDELTLPRGTKIAVVGTSGSGKSTLIDLLLGVLEPDSGEIHFNKNLFDRNVGMKNVAYMPQNITIFNRTIRENIALATVPDEIDDSLVKECIQMAGLEGLIQSLPNGTHEKIGEDGSTLSGGQKQRLGFARVMYQQPDFLVMDEGTSSLDSESEFAISETISSLKNGLSVLSVAHRLSTIQNFDLLLYMHNGKIEAVGTFDEVRSKSAAFNSQALRMGL
jgi:ABC-type bacteriocin/lantibiotic exporter with double-glycine peptidase domain